MNINSSTANPEGLKAIRSRLIPEFETLGFRAETKDLGHGHKVLSFRLPTGTPKGALIGHIYTVFDKTSAFQRFSVTGKTVHGPGVNDMKGGIVLMLMALTELKEAGLLNSIVVILNDDEEIGSPHSAATLKDLTKSIGVGLIYEPTLTSPEHVTTTQAGVEWLELHVKGKAAHAGAEHDKGINACVELALKIKEIAKLTNYSRKFTVNPGVIQGGTKANVVCEEASVKLDVRYVEDKDLVNFRKKLDWIVKKSFLYNPILKQGTQSSLKEIVHIPSLPLKVTKDLFDLAQTAGKKVGLALKMEHMGGASDANQLAPTGMKLLGGLGPWGTGAHSESESADLESFEKRKNLSVELIKILLK